MIKSVLLSRVGDFSITLFVVLVLILALGCSYFLVLELTVLLSMTLWKAGILEVHGSAGQIPVWAGLVTEHPLHVLVRACV